MSAVIKLGNTDFGANKLYQLITDKINLMNKSYRAGFYTYNGAFNAYNSGFIALDPFAIPSGYDYISIFCPLLSSPSDVVSNWMLCPIVFYDSSDNIISTVTIASYLIENFKSEEVYDVISGGNITQHFHQGYLCQPIPNGTAKIGLSLFSENQITDATNLYYGIKEHQIPLINTDLYLIKRT